MKLTGSHLTVAGVRIPLLLLAGVGVALVLAGGRGRGATLMAGPSPAVGTPAGSFVQIHDGSTPFPMPNPGTGYLQGSSP